MASTLEPGWRKVDSAATSAPVAFFRRTRSSTAASNLYQVRGPHLDCHIQCRGRTDEIETSIPNGRRARSTARRRGNLRVRGRGDMCSQQGGARCCRPFGMLGRRRCRGTTGGGDGGDGAGGGGEHAGRRRAASCGGRSCGDHWQLRRPGMRRTPWSGLIFLNHMRRRISKRDGKKKSW
jgi:hypothetical protein